MLAAFAKALAQFGDPAFRRPLMRSLVGAVLVFATLWLALGYVLAHTTLSEIAWLELVFEVLGGLAAVVLTFILFPGVVAAILSLMIDGVIEAVEVRHYPHLPPPRAQPLAAQIGGALRFLATVVVFNLAVLPLYLIPFVNLLVFYGLNGYLLGREYFEMVAPRRLGRPAQMGLWRRHRLGFLLAGVVIAFVSTLPLVNLVAPVLAAAAMTHLVETYRRSQPDATEV
jgi:CysZ protein